MNSLSREPGGLLLLASMLLGVACDAPRDEIPDRRGPSLVELEPVAVLETEDAYLGRPQYMSVAPGGSYFVSDAFLQNVKHIDPDGAILRTYGREGEGPGEFKGVAANLLSSDSNLAVYDYRQGRISLFELGDGELKEEFTLLPGVSDAVVGPGGDVWLGALDREAMTGVQRWNSDDSFTGLLPWPASYAESRRLAGIFTGVSLAFRGDTLLAMYSGSDDLILASPQGRVLSRVEVPSSRRRGVPDDVVRVLENGDGALLTRISSARKIHMLSTGELAILHYDLTIEDRVPHASAYVSILNETLSAACVDGMVPTTESGLPVPALKGDTLFLLQQHVDATATRATTQIHRFLIESTDCDWTPVSRVDNPY